MESGARRESNLKIPFYINAGIAKFFSTSPAFLPAERWRCDAKGLIFPVPGTDSGKCFVCQAGEAAEHPLYKGLSNPLSKKVCLVLMMWVRVISPHSGASQRIANPCWAFRASLKPQPTQFLLLPCFQCSPGACFPSICHEGDQDDGAGVDTWKEVVFISSECTILLSGLCISHFWRLVRKLRRQQHWKLRNSHSPRCYNVLF